MVEKLQSILEAEGLSALLSKFTNQGVTDSILGDLTDADLKDLGIEKLGERKRLLAAFLKSGGAAVAVNVVEEAAKQVSSSGAPSSTSATPSAATKESPFINSLGIPFVPIPRFETRFAVWPVRVQDYEAYCMASGAQFTQVPFSQDSDHPIVGVTWNDAIEFCIWLTGKERAEGKINEKTVYRLPTDLEWSAAVGLPHEPEPTPEKRHLKAPGYPWGLRWPPPRNAGNYEHRRDGDHFGLKFRMLLGKKHADDWEENLNQGIGDRQHGYNMLGEGRNTEAFFKTEYHKWLSSWKPVDEFEFTSPVQSFAPNSLGIYDLGGNVWEWCMEDNARKECVLRGASFWVPPEFKNAYQVSGGMWSANEDGYIENKLLYSSSFRLFENRNKYSAHSIYDENTESRMELPDGGFRLCLTTN
jgi:formylglycine-generating enzyme required for sulfatase activity